MLLHNVTISHCRAIKTGHIACTYAANNILLRYARMDFGQMPLACNLFDEMAHRDTVTWNTMISSFVNFGRLATALKFCKSMSMCQIEGDGRTFASLLKGIAVARRFDLGQQVHSLSVTTGYGQNVYVGSALLDMYAKCKRITDSYMVFKSMPIVNFVSWNALISGCVQIRDYEFAFWMFHSMEKEGVIPDDGTFSPLLTLLDDIKFYKAVLQLHNKILKHGLEYDRVVSNAMITSYSESGSLVDAKKVFDGLTCVRDLVTFNSMIAAYLVHEEKESAVKLFLNLKRCWQLEPDAYTFTTIISACSDEEHKFLGENLHGSMTKNGFLSSVQISNALLGMYLEQDISSMDKVLRIFHSMEMKDCVSWNSVITGLSQKYFSEDAIKFFLLMRTLQVGIDHYALSASLRSCSDLATLQLGQEIHGFTFKLGLECNEFVASSLIFMYYKCGVIADARKSFEECSNDSSIVWNSIIFAYAQHGEGHRALEHFYLMRERKMKIDHFTFVAALTACSHVGFVKHGRLLFDSMASVYGVSPRMEHYACIVDLYGRAGLLEEAKNLIATMPFEPDAMVWKTMLGACKACGDIDFASEVANRLLELDCQHHSMYVILSSMYGDHGRWDEKGFIKKKMRESGIRKVPGCSWIEVNNKISSFRAEDSSEANYKEISVMVGVLMGEIKFLNLGNSLKLFLEDR